MSGQTDNIVQGASGESLSVMQELDNNHQVSEQSDLHTVGGPSSDGSLSNAQKNNETSISLGLVHNSGVEQVKPSDLSTKSERSHETQAPSEPVTSLLQASPMPQRPIVDSRLPTRARPPSIVIQEDERQYLLSNFEHPRQNGDGASAADRHSPTTPRRQPTDPVTRERDSLIPLSAPCLLNVTFDGLDVLCDHKGPDVRRDDEGEFRKLRKVAEDAIRQKYDDILADMRMEKPNPLLYLDVLYIRHGSCRVVSGNKKQEASVLDDEKKWTETLSRIILNFVHKDMNSGIEKGGSAGYSEFQISIDWEFSSLHLKESKDEVYSKVVKKEMARKTKPSIRRNAEFLPHSDLNNIFSMRTIRTLVEKDHSLSEDVDREEFSRDIFKSARKLLAICVLAKVELAFLKYLRSISIGDAALPLDKDKYPIVSENEDFRDLIKFQNQILAHRFVNPRSKEHRNKDHLELGPDVVLPITYEANPEKSKIGHGAFGEVYKVLIDPAHHPFSAERKQCFAIKRFRGRTRSQIHFEREKEMLKALSVKPHEHILSYLVTWAQNDDFYVLLPCAERNLRVFMQTEQRPDLTADFVLWFLQELRGVADGVRSIHHLNSQAMQGLSGQPNPQGLTVPQQRRLSGFHHDLKPDNILLFASEGSLHGVMKIADFGTGKISAIQSGVISFFVERNQGTETYEAPDVYMYKKASRPQDMWSMGCIILELMYWAFIDRQPPNRSFSTERFDSQNDANDAFWMPVRDEKGNPIRDAKGNLTVALKPAVANRISQLKEICKDKRAFSDIMTEIDGLLNFSTNARIPARQLYDDLDAIVYQATIDLDENPDCYIEDGNFPTARATPPSPVPSTIGYGRHVDRDVIPLPTGVLGEPAHYPQPAAARSLEFANVGGHLSLKPPESPGKGGSHAVAPASKYFRETRHEVVHTVDTEKEVEPSAAVTALGATRFDKLAPDHTEIDLDHLGNAQPRQHSREHGIFPWNKKTSGVEPLPL